MKIRQNGIEEILIAYNKKRLNDEDIIKAHKKALEAGLKYRVLSLGGPLKKTENLIRALKDLKEIQKIS